MKFFNFIKWAVIGILLAIAVAMLMFYFMVFLVRTFGL